MRRRPTPKQIMAVIVASDVDGYRIGLILGDHSEREVVKLIDHTQVAAEVARWTTAMLLRREYE